jgi:hypothetical protein
MPANTGVLSESAIRKLALTPLFPEDIRGIHSRSSRSLARHMAELAAAVADVAFGVGVSSHLQPYNSLFGSAR